MKVILKNYFFYLIFFYTIILIYFSLNVGITHDESHHNTVWLINKKIYSNYLLGTNYEILFPDFGMNFYGIGFQVFSIPFSFILNLITSKIEYLSNINVLIDKHPAIIILFIISGIYLKKIIDFITRDKFFSEICSIFFLLYPYILGHSFFNTLDVPFMSVWLICTYYIIKMSSLFLHTKMISNKDVIYLALLSGFLLSIRISGVLIFFEYLIFLIFIINNSGVSIFEFIKNNYKKIILFLFIMFFLFISLHPNYWNDFSKIYYSILYMGQHIQTVCTLTLGTCMKAQNLPSSYIPIWLFFKLPIVILLGLLIFPIIEKKIFSNKNNIIILGSLLSSCIFIILNLIIFNVNLYDELRQILFLIPIIFIISMSFLFCFSRRLSLVLISSFILFFLIQNIKIFPYNYIWLNNFSTFTKINNIFELDYWGVSTKNIGNFINSKNIQSDECIISKRNYSIKIFLQNKMCFKKLNELHQKNHRPFYVALLERGLKKGLPNNCTNIHNESIKINFSDEKIIVAKVFKCD